MNPKIYCIFVFVRLVIVKRIAYISYGITFCQHENISSSLDTMSISSILDGLKFSHYNFFKPIFVHSKNKYDFEDIKDYEAYRIHHIVPAKFYKEAAKLKDYILVFENDDLELPIMGLNECQLNINSHNISSLYVYTKILLSKSRKVNINVTNLDRDFNESEYRKQLVDITNHLVELNKLYNEDYYKINLLDDIITEAQNQYPEHKNCKAGDRSFTYAPNRKLYICSAYYSVQPASDIGNIEIGITKIKSQHLYKVEYQPICNRCDAYHCINCVYLNESTTREVNVSPSYQCRKSHIEREMAAFYMLKRHKTSKISYVDYHDPMECFIIENNLSKNEYMGIYKY